MILVFQFSSNIMPKKQKNIRIEAAKIVAGKQAVNDVVEKMQRGDSTAGMFWHVVKSLGFKSFLIKDHNGKQVRGTAGHGGGKVTVTIGCIVLTPCPNPHVDGVEILAVIDSLKEAKHLVRLGVLHPSFISEQAQSTTDDAFVFAPLDDAVLGVLRESQHRSLQESRAEEVTQRSIDRRVRYFMREDDGGDSSNRSAIRQLLVRFLLGCDTLDFDVPAAAPAAEALRPTAGAPPPFDSGAVRVGPPLGPGIAHSVELQFPPGALSSLQRALVHEAAEALGAPHWSAGEGALRAITVAYALPSRREALRANVGAT